MRARIVGGLLLAGVLALPVWTQSAHADGMRCGTRLVSDGDTMYEVRNACGAPDQAVQRTETRVVSRWVEVPCNAPTGRCGTLVQQAIEVQVDEWLYDFGPRQLLQYVIFEAGRLIRTSTGGYGQKVI